GRVVFEPPRQGRGGLYRRKIADPGAGPDRADPTDPPRAARESHPRLRAPRHYHLVRGPGGGDREGHRRLPSAPHPRRVPGVPQTGRQAHPRVPLHVVADNYATHKHPAVQAWLAKHPRVRMHFTPTSGSWLNLVEVFFGIITRQAIRRGTFTSVKDLIAAIETFIDGWNDRCQPFVWTK